MSMGENTDYKLSPMMTTNAIHKKLPAFTIAAI